MENTTLSWEKEVQRLKSVIKQKEHDHVASAFVGYMKKIGRNDMGYPEITQEGSTNALYGCFKAILTLGAILALTAFVYAAIAILAQSNAHAEDSVKPKNVIVALGFSNYQICEAIRKTENSKAHPYGIMVKYKHTTAKQACLNTIQHLRRKYILSGSHGDFIEFMGRTYSPPAINPNWVRLVKYFLAKETV